MRRLIYLSNFSESYSYNLLKGVMNYTREHTPWIICRMPQHFKTEQGLEGVLKWAINWNADAIIGRFDEGDDVECFARNGILCIAQDMMTPFKTIPNITSDYRATGRLAARFFIDKNFKHFAFYGLRGAVWSTERREGFKDVLRQRGFIDRFRCFEEEASDEIWLFEQRELLEWLHSLPVSTALFACDDNMGTRISDLCRVNGIAVPDNIAILGVDNDEILDNLSDPPLSSISLDVTKAGYQVAEMIDRVLDSKGSIKPTDIYVETRHIISRMSTEYIAMDDPHVHTALKFLHENINGHISVNDVVKQVPLSRRLLEIRFKEVTKQSIYAYLFALRMERFAHLLKVSDEPIAHLAEQVGISNIKNLSRQFKATYGTSPSEYRKTHQSK